MPLEIAVASAFSDAQPGAVPPGQRVAAGDGGGFLTTLEATVGEIAFDCDTQQIEHAPRREQVAERAGRGAGCALAARWYSCG